MSFIVIEVMNNRVLRHRTFPSIDEARNYAIETAKGWNPFRSAEVEERFKQHLNYAVNNWSIDVRLL